MDEATLPGTPGLLALFDVLFADRGGSATASPWRRREPARSRSSTRWPTRRSAWPSWRPSGAAPRSRARAARSASRRRPRWRRSCRRAARVPADRQRAEQHVGGLRPPSDPEAPPAARFRAEPGARAHGLPHAPGGFSGRPPARRRGRLRGRRRGADDPGRAARVRPEPGRRVDRRAGAARRVLRGGDRGTRGGVAGPRVRPRPGGGRRARGRTARRPHRAPAPGAGLGPARPPPGGRADHGADVAAWGDEMLAQLHRATDALAAGLPDLPPAPRDRAARRRRRHPAG